MPSGSCETIEPKARSAGRDDPLSHELSRGGSTLELIGTYLGSPGTYCLADPGTALSFTSTLVLFATLRQLAANDGAQMLCSTRSTRSTRSALLTALPCATEVGQCGLRETTWDDLVVVANWRSYLTESCHHLRHVLGDGPQAG